MGSFALGPLDHLGLLISIILHIISLLEHKSVLFDLIWNYESGLMDIFGNRKFSYHLQNLLIIFFYQSLMKFNFHIENQTNKYRE